ncbi:hypothetical protein BDN70DRAFT_885624 [Pholiota conissans]|uniref:ubiquitinyl hydrolase 1 n=1 Tax=Pholiota conissans TaxID=109636 RepID=A0A9P5YQS4_9AGAR|nr:hypothetical protein BDN70DRAFT_885624 [Pholiota conissans]
MVTLGPKVTKDKVIQGCMRMRNLGHGQSIVFCAPPEVDRYIRKGENIDSSRSIQVADVLSWAMTNTCADIQNHIPNWVEQGVYYRKRRDGSGHAESSARIDAGMLKTSWLEPAARTLDEMYGLDMTKVKSSNDKDIPSDMQVRLKLLGITEVSSEAMAEEQEREVNHELEEESQIERPPKISAAAHKLAEEVRNFVRRGVISASSEVFLPLMAPISSVAVAVPSSPKKKKKQKPQIQTHIQIQIQSHIPWAKQLLCTRDFLTVTAVGNEKTSLTEFLRPVNWIVSRICEDGSTMLVVMSPYEVNALLDEIRQSKFVRLHVYAPRTIESMKPFDLSFYCIPAVESEPTTLVTLNNNIGYQLNIWAGQLYLDNYESYLRLCLLLGLSSSESDNNTLIESDRFVPKEGRSKEMSAVCLFDKSPLPLLKVLFGLRRKGMSFQSTHMGKILQARLLTPKDFED